MRDIKVVYSVYNNSVIVDTLDDAIVLFNHNNITPKKDYGVFTGISIVGQEGVHLRIFDLDFNKLQFIVSQGYLYIDIEDNLVYDKPICLVEFYPKNNFMDIKKFKPHLIEKRSF